MSIWGFGYASHPTHPLHHLWCIEMQAINDEIDAWFALLRAVL